MKRPWLVTGNSHEHEWNGRVGSRFAHEDKARQFAKRNEDDGWYNVHVIYDPVREATMTTTPGPSTAAGKRLLVELGDSLPSRLGILAIEAEARADVDGLVAAARAWDAARTQWVEKLDERSRKALVKAGDRLSALLAGDKAEAPE